ncbi:MAG: universal stress protein [Desulfotignum sp.]|jgi:nucleotide-binding universal stress UspA family protein|nr:universal stress protein [Desulfotignum sp.]
MFKKILFATNASPACDAAAKIAFELAQKYDAELTLFHVFGEPSRGASQRVKSYATGQEAELGPDYVEWIKQEMQTTYRDLADKYTTPVYAAKAGIPSTEILRLARDMDADCIIMGAHARQDDTAAERFRGIVGTTMQKVAQRAKCPVLIISRPCETCFWYFNQIIFGTDFSKASLAAFQFAYKMASHIGCKLHLFHALDIQVSQAGIPPGQKSIETRIAEAKTKIQEHYVSLMDNFDNYEITVWEGVPYVELLKYAREASADLIVMAHHTRELDPDDALFGSTVEQVVLRSACPVASVNRPDKL